jgi:hypothetical protein
MAAKHVLWFLAGTPSISIVYRKGGGPAKAFSNADYLADVDMMRHNRSQSLVMKNGAVLLWSSKLQAAVTTSTCEAQYSTVRGLENKWIFLGLTRCIDLHHQSRSRVLIRLVQPIFRRLI